MVDILKLSNDAATGNWLGCNEPGRVEDVEDPLKIGRVRVRIWAIHGDVEDTPLESLPWAMVKVDGGAGHDHGPSSEFINGDDVLCGFLNRGDPSYPVVLGGLHGIASLPIEMITTRGQGQGQTWIAPEGTTYPKDVFEDHSDDKHPTRTAWKKSYKGHTILVEDRDGEEFLKIIDRAGQIIEMSCPVQVVANADNAEQRGTRDVTKGNQVGHDKMVSRRGFVKITDLSGQTILLDARDGHENISIISRDRAGIREQKLVLSAALGADGFSLTDAVGNTITSSAWGDEQLVLRSLSGSALVMSKNGDVAVRAARNYSIEADGETEETYRRNRKVTFLGNLRERVLGNRFISALGNLALSSGSSMTQTIQGAFQSVVMNASLSGVAVNGWVTRVVTGNVLFESLAGKFSLNTILGSLKIGAGLLGVSASVEVDSVGNVTISNLAGKSIKLTPAGITTIGGTTPADTITMLPDGTILMPTATGLQFPCNNLPNCLFAGVVHGLNPKVLV